MRRRDVLKLAGTSGLGMGAAVAFAGCGTPDREFHIQSPVEIPEDTITGLDTWYASICQDSGDGCGVIVRVKSGRARKIEGNPDYPLNRGKSSARAQAALQTLYNPDRIPNPMIPRRNRGSGRYRFMRWDDVLPDFQERLSAAQNGGIVMITEPVNGHLGMILERFTQNIGARWLTFEPLEQAAVRQASAQVFGTTRVPQFDIANTAYVLSIGGNFLEGGDSPVHYGQAYGEFRQGENRSRGTFAHFDTHLTMTAANADEWHPVNPGTEGILALSIAHAVLDGRPVPAALQPLTGGEGSLDAYAAEQVADVTGVPVEVIERVAHDFAAAPTAVAMGGGSAAGHTNGLSNMAAIFALNLLKGNVGRQGGVLLNAPSPLPDIPAEAPVTSYEEWETFLSEIESGQVPQVLLIHGANPVYGLPGVLNAAGVLDAIPYIVSFSNVLDETTALADLILPDHHYLESWGTSVPPLGAEYSTLGVQQPVVRPYHQEFEGAAGTRAFADVLLGLAQTLGGPLAEALPWDSMRDAIRASVDELQARGDGSVTSDDPEVFWLSVLQRGGWWVASEPVTAEAPDLSGVPAMEPEFSSDAEDYPYHLIVTPSVLLGDGSGSLAASPWLQSTADPMTTGVWGTWVALSPKTMEALSIQENDIVRITSTAGSLLAPAYPYPGIGEGVVSVPLGQGHQELGRYAENRGENALRMLAPVIQEQTGALAWSATRVRIAPTGRRTRLPRIEGITAPVQMPDEKTFQVTNETQ
ncbi:MAG: molybdopterin-dependent oxidoreductase [Chloroflexi bacterium]|nr:molybdopterin-dependent oxidoreductase [Chloroflexota bacterium]